MQPVLQCSRGSQLHAISKHDLVGPWLQQCSYLLSTDARVSSLRSSSNTAYHVCGCCFHHCCFSERRPLLFQNQQLLLLLLVLLPLLLLLLLQVATRARCTVMRLYSR